MVLNHFGGHSGLETRMDSGTNFFRNTAAALREWCLHHKSYKKKLENFVKIDLWSNKYENKNADEFENGVDDGL